MSVLKRSITFNGAVLGGFAVVTVGIVAFTQQMTEEPIAASRLKAARAALYEVVPQDKHDNDLFNDTRPLPENLVQQLGVQGRNPEQQLVHVARRDGKPVAVVVPTVAPDGYSGRIDMIMGIDDEGRILGLRVTSHNETPGLGDKIEVRKSNWILSFNGKTTESTIDGLDAEFDQLTGATITREAISRQVKKTLAAVEESALLRVDTGTGSVNE